MSDIKKRNMNSIYLKSFIREKICIAVKEQGFPIIEGSTRVTTPPTKEMGDFSCAYPIIAAKKAGMNPVEIGERLIKVLKKSFKEIGGHIEFALPGYINITVSNEILDKVPEIILAEGRKWGSKKINGTKKILVEYSSPNIAKMMHVGHLRTTIIGHALDNLFRHLGYVVISDNHIGDWGTQFGKLMVAYRHWYNKNTHTQITIEELEELYVRFGVEAKKDEGLMIQARNETVKLQNGERDAKNLWRLFCEISLREFNRIYELLGIIFDRTNGESFYEQMLPSVIDDALNKKVAIQSQGAIIIPLDEFGLPPFMIKKSDGGFLYATTDLATIKWREEHLKPDVILYVVADQQELHFKQLFAAAQKLGYRGNAELIHVPFGLVLGADGKKMSTREGETVSASSLIQKSIEYARKIIEQKNPTLSPSDTEMIATRIGIGALIYNDLSHERSSAIKFNWDIMMNQKGDSAPYLLYTYVRIQGIMRKKDFSVTQQQPSVLPQGDTVGEERDLLLELSKFPDVLEETAETLQMHILINYLSSLAGSFHRFYDKVPVLKAPEAIRKKRLNIIEATAHTLRNGLAILGITPVEKM